MLKFVLLILSGIICCTLCTTESSSSYHLCRLMSIHKEDLKRNLKYIESGQNDVIFLNEAVDDAIYLYFLVTETKKDELNRKIQGILLICHPLENDIDVNLLRIKVANPNRNNQTDFSLDEYHQLIDTYRWLKKLPENYPGKVNLIEIGRSHMNEEIIGVNISYRSGNKAIFIEAGSHPQEWISSAIVNYIIDKLLTIDDLTMRSLIESYDWYLVPHSNPDGYVRTFEVDRFWSKTVAPQETCLGVDFNRNWGLNFTKEPYTSRYPCDKGYPGIRPFSEKETKAFQTYLNGTKDKLFFYMTIDGPDRKIYTPNNNETLRNYSELKHIVDSAINAIAERFRTKYNGTNAKRFQPLSGTSMDWVYENLNVNYSFTFHLPPAYEFEEKKFFDTKFLMPSNRIITIGEEVFFGLMQMVKLAGNLQLSKSSESSMGVNKPLDKVHRYFDGLLADYD